MPAIREERAFDEAPERPPRVLVVDDDQDVLDAMCCALSEGYEVVGATGGARAVSLLGEYEFEFTVWCTTAKSTRDA
jgi:PleD family two-component response regulator